MIELNSEQLAIVLNKAFNVLIDPKDLNLNLNIQTEEMNLRITNFSAMNILFNQDLDLVDNLFFGIKKVEEQ